jgi:hypothetical protein
MRRVMVVLVVAALGILGVAGSALAERGGTVILPTAVGGPATLR